MKTFALSPGDAERARSDVAGFSDPCTFRVGELDCRLMHSPGHTLASINYVIGDAAFVHDTLFQPDFGTARADFPGGCAHQL